MSVPEIQAEDLKQRLDKGEQLLLLDVRDEYEYEISNIGGHLIPLAELPKRFTELNERQEIVAVCKMGPRGVKAVEFLQKHGFRRSAIFVVAFTHGLTASIARSGSTDQPMSVATSASSAIGLMLFAHTFNYNLSDFESDRVKGTASG